MDQLQSDGFTWSELKPLPVRQYPPPGGKELKENPLSENFPKIYRLYMFHSNVNMSKVKNLVNYSLEYLFDNLHVIFTLLHTEVRAVVIQTRKGGRGGGGGGGLGIFQATRIIIEGFLWSVKSSILGFSG